MRNAATAILVGSWSIMGSALHGRARHGGKFLSPAIRIFVTPRHGSHLDR